MTIPYRNRKPTRFEFERRNRMSGSGGLRYNNIEIRSGTAQLRLQQVGQLRARLA
jgi:hypothetical protein